MKNNPIKQLSAEDLKRKQTKLNTINTKLEDTSISAGKRKRLGERKFKTEYQIKTGERGRPTSLRNQAWLDGTSRKSSSPVNNYQSGYYGVEEKSALNMLGIQPKSPLNDMTEAENEAKAKAEMHRVASVNDRYALDITGKYDKEYDEYTDKHGYIDPEGFDVIRKTERIENPEYANLKVTDEEFEATRISPEHDLVRTGSEESKDFATQMAALNKEMSACAKDPNCSTRTVMAKQNALKKKYKVD